MNETFEKNYIENNDIWGLPQTYKGVNFFPLKIFESKYIDLMHKVFGLPKKYIKEPEIKKLTYFKFIIYVVQNSINPEGEEIKYNLINLLKHCTQKENIDIIYRIKNDLQMIEDINFYIKIEDIEFDESDFDYIRELILKQNGYSVEYVEQYIPSLEEKLDFVNRNLSDLTFEDQIFSFCALMRKSIDEIKNYTLFQFKSQLDRLMILKEYDIYKPLESSGAIKLQNGEEIRHYLSHIKKSGRYDSILIKKDDYVGKNSIFKVSQTQK